MCSCSPYVQTEIGRYQGGKGTGLGLALVRRIVKLSGGRLGVKSKLGQGSEFWVELRTSKIRSLSPSHQTRPKQPTNRPRPILRPRRRRRRPHTRRRRLRPEYLLPRLWLWLWPPRLEFQKLRDDFDRASSRCEFTRIATTKDKDMSSTTHTQRK